jgi:hypothetical protein
MVSKKAAAKAKRKELFSLKKYLERKEQKKLARHHGHHH